MKRKLRSVICMILMIALGVSLGVTAFAAPCTTENTLQRIAAPQAGNTELCRTSDDIVGYNMVLYVTQEAADPHYRNFRSYSINGMYNEYGARKSYGEKKLTRYATVSELAYATIYSEGSFVYTSYLGYNKGGGNAFYFGDNDGYVYFIESPVYRSGNTTTPSTPNTPSNGNIVGYNMVLYVTQEAADPHYRNFRGYSINGCYNEYAARKSYGEKHITKYVTASELASATIYKEGSFVNTSYLGYNKGSGNAYYFGENDGYVYFIESVVYR